MRVIEFLVVASMITARTCRSEIVLPSSKPDKLSANLVKDLVEIVTSCYEDRPRTLGLAGNLPKAALRILSTEHKIPVVWIGFARNHSTRSPNVPDKFRHKIHHFIIEASTASELHRLISNNIRSSIWWNHMASFTLVDRSARCHHFLDFLRASWFWGIINAKVLCCGTKVSRLIMNYNPFTSQAPAPWRRYGVVRMIWINDYPVTFYVHDYKRDKSICMNLDFEKTKDLGGYKIVVDGPEEHVGELITGDHDSLRKLFSAERILSLVCRTLNATLKYGATTVFDEKFFDIQKYPGLVFGPLGFSLTTYPHETNGIIIISQFRGYNTRLNDIFHALDTYVWIGVGIVYLITFIFFKFYVRQAIIPSLFNILRMTCNAGFMNIPDDIPSRIYLSCLFFFWTIIQGFFLCDLATLLTTKFPLRNINTIEDFETLGYKVCMEKAKVFPISFKGPLIITEVVDCFKYSKNSSSVAYITDDLGVSLYGARAFKLHVSREPIRFYYLGFMIRRNWALEGPFNRVIATLLEADALMPWELKYKGLKLSDFEHDDEHKFTEDYKPLQLNELAFAFEFLGLGLACATVCFIFELAIPYMTRYNCIRKCIAALRHYNPMNYC